VLKKVSYLGQQSFWRFHPFSESSGKFRRRLKSRQVLQARSKNWPWLSQRSFRSRQSNLVVQWRQNSTDTSFLRSVEARAESLQNPYLIGNTVFRQGRVWEVSRISQTSTSSKQTIPLGTRQHGQSSLRNWKPWTSYQIPLAGTEV